MFITIVPTNRNDGTEVTTDELNEILKGFWERFGGATVEGPTEGHWIDERDGRHYQDRGMKVTVATSRDRLQDAIEAVKEMGRRLEQEAVYMEVRYYDGVQILSIT